MIFVIFLLLTRLISMVNGDCGCLNQGVCNKDFTCSCPNGYYGPICQQYAEKYVIQYAATPSGVRKIDIITRLTAQLEFLAIQDAFAIGLGNLYAVSFHKALTNNDRSKLKAIAIQVANNEPVSALADYDECKDGKQSCYNGLKCQNTLYSFTCGCPTGYNLKDNRCMQEVDNANTKTVIYVWAAAVGGVILFTLACLMFYRHRKIEKGKKTAIEQQQKKMANRGRLTPTNLSDYDGQNGRRTSPTASVVDGPSRYSMNDVASIYSYNAGAYGQPDNTYYGTQTRLSIPMDNGQINGGYEGPIHMRYPSSDSYNQSASYTMNNGSNMVGSFAVSETAGNRGPDNDQLGMYNERSIAYMPGSSAPSSYDHKLEA